MLFFNRNTFTTLVLYRIVFHPVFQPSLTAQELIVVLFAVDNGCGLRELQRFTRIPKSCLQSFELEKPPSACRDRFDA